MSHRRTARGKGGTVASRPPPPLFRALLENNTGILTLVFVHTDASFPMPQIISNESNNILEVSTIFTLLPIF